MKNTSILTIKSSNSQAHKITIQSKLKAAFLKSCLGSLALAASFTSLCTLSAQEASAISLPSQSVISHFMPQIELATGENCAEPGQGNGTGEAFYYVQAHPDNPSGAVLVSTSVLMLQDCGLSGHKGAPGVDPHPYDREFFYMTLVPSTACTGDAGGWKLHSIKTRAHNGTFERREITEREIEGDGCSRPSPLVMSLGKHAIYKSWLDCSKRTPAEFCAGAGDKIKSMNLHYVSSVDNARTTLKTVSPFENINAQDFIGDDWNQTLFHPDQLGAIGGLPNPGNTSNDHSCVYGADWDAGLCYKKCKDGYKGAATMCLQSCPSDFTDTGLDCLKPKSYGRGAGYTSRKDCEKHHGSCEKYGLLYYPVCKDGYKAVGCCVCSPVCTNGMTDIGISCQKKTYDRGVGVIP